MYSYLNGHVDDAVNWHRSVSPIDRSFMRYDILTIVYNSTIANTPDRRWPQTQVNRSSSGKSRTQSALWFYGLIQGLPSIAFERGLDHQRELNLLVSR